MSRIVRALVGGMFILGIVGCGAAAGTVPAAHEARSGACLPGFVFDGARCRKQRGIIIDQKDQDRRPTPPTPAPPAPPAPPGPVPLPGPAPLPPS